MSRIKAGQTDLLASSPGLTRDVQGRYRVEIAPTGGLQISGTGVGIKNLGVTSPMLAAGSVLAAHVGFNDTAIPNTSAAPGATIKDALDGLAGVSADYVRHDGTVPMTGNLDLGGFKATGMAAGVAPSDAVTLLQMQNAIVLGTRWLYNTSYAGISSIHGALRNGFIRATQTIRLIANPVAGNVLTINGATITFVNSPPPPAVNQCEIGISAAVTAANLVTAIHAAIAPTAAHGTPLGTAVRAIRETTGTGQTVHLVWLDDDLPGRIPTDAHAYGCATNNPAAITFVNYDVGGGLAVFYGAYNSLMDGATINARYENAVYNWNNDVPAWTLIYANPGSGFFAKVTGDLGGIQNAGADDTLYVEGDGLTIKTTSSFAPGPKVTIEHRDASALAAPFHSEASVKTLSAYSNVGTGIGNTQAQFNGAVDVLIGDLRDVAWRNVLVNASFLDDPVAGSPYGVSGTTVPCMPGWALQDVGLGGLNIAAATWDAVGPAGGPLIGTHCARVNVTQLNEPVDKEIRFYQPIIGPEVFAGRKVSFRIAVHASSNVKAYIESSAGIVVGTMHSGGGGWEVLYITTTLAAPETLLRVGIKMTALDTVYVDVATLVVGGGFTALPFIAREEVDDRQLIASMYHKVELSDMLWGAPVGGTAYLSHVFPNTMVAVPGAATAILAQPGGCNCTITPSVTSDRNVVLDITEAGAWGGAVLPARLQYTLEADARPT